MPKLVLYSDQIIPENAKIDQHLRALIGKDTPKFGYIFELDLTLST